MPSILPFQGRAPKIAADAWVAPGATVIGDVEIGARSSIWFGCIVRGDVNVVRIGRGSNLQDGTIVHVSGREQGTFIGDGVLIGHACVIHACTVADGAFVGMRACVMDGAVVEGGAMVAAGALVTPGKVVRSGQLWAGSPAKHVRDLTAAEAAYIPAAADRYARYAEEYRRALAKAAE